MPIKLVASDLDGTLIDHNNFIPINNLNAIQSINEKNINFAICTGKTYAITKSICDKCNASYGIFGNGTQIINLKTGEEIYKNLVPISDFNICYEIAKKYNLHVHIYTDKEIITPKLEYMDLRNFVLNGNKYVSDNLSFIIVEDMKRYVNDNNPQIFKLVISSDSNIEKVKSEILNQLNLNVVLIRKCNKFKDVIINKEYEYLDITPTNIGKGYAINYLSNFLNVNTSDVMAIGDNVNDIDMLKACGIGVTLADSYDEVKQIATYTTVNSAHDSGFAEAINKYVL